MALINVCSALVLLFIFGSSAGEGEECTLEQFEACSGLVVKNLGDVKKLCGGAGDEALQCFQELTCTKTADMIKEIESMQKKIEESRCEDVETAKNDSDSSSSSFSCTQDAVSRCVNVLIPMEGVNFCRQVETATPCLKRLADCQDASVKALLQEKQTEMNKKKDELKCCSTREMQSCEKFQVNINNETANDENCMTAAKAKECVEGFLETCEEAELVGLMKAAFNKSVMQVDFCKDKGYTVSDGDGNSSTVHQPALVLVSLAAILVRLLRQRSF